MLFRSLELLERRSDVHDHLVAGRALEVAERSLEHLRRLRRQQAGAIEHVRPQLGYIERAGIARERETGECEGYERGARGARAQNFTSGGFSAPGVASNVGRGSACRMKRAVRFVGK